MKHIGTKIITHIVIYVIAIIGIFILQFKSAKTFSLNIGAMLVSGRNDVIDGKTVPLLPIQVVSNGISFFVSDKDSIEAHGETGKQELKVESYSNTATDFTIHCNEGVSITFNYDKFGDIEVLHVSSSMPEMFDSVTVPWKIAANAKFEIKNRKSLVTVSKKSFQFDGNFGFNEMGIVDSSIEQPRLTLYRSGHQASYTSYIESKEFTTEMVAMLPGSTEPEYRAKKEDFASLVLNLTRDAISKRNYTEQTLVAYIAEMARRNMYISALENAPSSLLAKQNKTALSLPFYGNIIDLYNEIIDEENLQRQNLSRLISNRSLAIFEVENLIAYLVDRNSTVLIEDLNSILEQSDLSTVSLSQAIGIVECWLNYKEYFPNGDNFFEKNVETCFRKITDSFVIINQELYSTSLENDSTFCDTLLSLRLSKMLLASDNEAWHTIGYKIFTSVCALIGVDGSIAKKYTITNENETRGIVVNDELILSAAQVYPYIVENSWYPKAHSLHEARHGMWMYGSAKNINVIEAGNGTVRFSVEGVKDGAEYFIVRNVQQLRTIVIHGLEYRSDRRFETYNSSGYVYNANTATLYLKLKHKKEIEEIVLQMGM